jgi:hypothetical protein
MACTNQIGADVFAAPQQIADGFLFGGNVDPRERASAIEDRQLRGVAAIGLDPATGAAWDQREAMTSPSTRSVVNACCNSKPHALAS